MRRWSGCPVHRGRDEISPTSNWMHTSVTLGSSHQAPGPSFVRAGDETEYVRLNDRKDKESSQKIPRSGIVVLDRVVLGTGLYRVTSR